MHPVHTDENEPAAAAGASVHAHSTRGREHITAEQERLAHVLTNFGRRIGVRIAPKSLAPRVLEALRALGYSMVDLDSERLPEQIRESCGLWLVDDERLSELPGPSEEPDRRILLIASARSASVSESCASCCSS